MRPNNSTRRQYQQPTTTTKTRRSRIPVESTDRDREARRVKATEHPTNTPTNHHSHTGPSLRQSHGPGCGLLGWPAGLQAAPGPSPIAMASAWRFHIPFTSLSESCGQVPSSPLVGHSPLSTHSHKATQGHTRPAPVSSRPSEWVFLSLAAWRSSIAERLMGSVRPQRQKQRRALPKA